MISLCDKSVVIIDPAINNADNYKPYQDGIGQDIFIKVCEDSCSLLYKFIFVMWRFVYVTKIYNLVMGEDEICDCYRGRVLISV